ncbi:MAG: DNA polymerase III subunit gamma/tau [Candidatus Omnitrophica bacterium]|nr:DNA polymerase III subunit gamma/tau [Candidatus Omnitrophota bacterium]
MSYIVFARKWRPKDFESVLGQEHVTTTLRNAIANNRVAHAYIFSGPRGVGKTTTARIFAMALNCKEASSGKDRRPCGTCDSCKEISSGTNLDVIEIDGASNRGIDEVRSLRENIKFAPTRGKYKVYIIDEVHMLTEEAFNALLKTLEEPPAHAIFIFATTRPYKVPSTIISRCQRFDFKRLTVNEIAGKLRDIARSEKLEIEEEALYTVARAAEGAMRDAESMLDQLVSFCGKKIDVESAAAVSGTVGQEVLFGFTEKVINRDTHGVLKLVDGMISGGKDIPQFVNSLVVHFRNLLITKTAEAGDLENLVDLPKEIISRVSEQAKPFTNETLLYILTVLMNAQDEVRRAISQRIPLELAAIRLTRRDDIFSLTTILDRIEKLEKKIGSAAAAPVPVKAETKKANDANDNDIEVDIEISPAAATAGAGSRDLSFELICELWPNLLRGILSKKMSVALFLQPAQPLKLDNKTLTIAFSKEHKFNKEALEGNGNRKVIENALNDILKHEIRVDMKVVEALENKVPVEDLLREEHEEEAHEVVRSALEIFGGNLKKTDNASY